MQKSMRPSLIKKNNFSLIIASLFLLSCKPSSSSGIKAIIGADDRVLADDAFVSARFGRLLGPASTCNASLVESDVILTALHCVPEKRETKFLFFTADNKFEARVVGIERKSEELDQVYLKLDKKSNNFFEINSNGDGSLSYSKMFIYDSNEGVMVDKTACFTSNSQTVFNHRCDTLPGNSGAPIVMDRKIIGIHNGFDLIKKVNVASRIIPTDNSKIEYAALMPEIQCGADCYKHCRRKIIGTWVENPVCEAVCVTERQIDCSSGSKEVKICGYGFGVNSLVHYACVAASAAIPPACGTAVAVPGAITACTTAGTLASGICGVSVEVIKGAAVACIASASGIDPSKINFDWKK